MTRKRLLSFVLVLMGFFTLIATVSADPVDVIQNGSFEGEFAMGVGAHWTAFNNGGHAVCTYSDDTWDKTVSDGEHSQLIAINTGGSESDRYTGIYQVVDVVSGGQYILSLQGMIRSTEKNEQESNWNHRVQIGFDYNGGTDYTAVSEWTELPWQVYPRLSPPPFRAYIQGVTPTSSKLTVFIRVWKKFPTVGQEGDVNIDAVSLVGPDPNTSSAASSGLPAGGDGAPTLPQSGVGSLLPLVGMGLGALAIGLTRRRLAGSR